ncbi:response regulator transcription factor [Roseateles koreensis]|uniref:Response regulator transcription factor n=1 Tax=Roseateles koreensis TaxID=2987526 RepID=A0ABT5KQ69_9BURK|nr:response regulator transcription factor [Roseateles koreensis]MDC8785007.1 response regulator transcription factor [Roseateles koreensis]
MRILVVEDDPTLSQIMQRSLADAGHHVDLAGTAEQANYLWRILELDAVLLDLSLPDGHGLNVLREARARGDGTPVLVLTARNRTEERIAGLDAGADDYLGKPFELAEVEARLRALVRRRLDLHDQARVGRLLLDRRARRVFLDGDTLDLPAREFEVLWELMTPPGRVVSKAILSDKLSGFDDALGANALEAFVSRLRKKLLGSGAGIRTLRGLGYLMETEEALPAAPTLNETGRKP